MSEDQHQLHREGLLALLRKRIAELELEFGRALIKDALGVLHHEHDPGVLLRVPASVSVKIEA